MWLTSQAPATVAGTPFACGVGTTLRQPVARVRPTSRTAPQGRMIVRTPSMVAKQSPSSGPGPDIAALLRELVSHLRQNRTQLREEWARRITRAQLLTAMTEEEIFAEATSVYDNYVEALETGTFEALQAYARNLSER